MQRRRSISRYPLAPLFAACLAAAAGAQPRAGVTVYAAGDFRGASETFYGDVPNMGNTRVGNDHASSVRVAPGCSVILYAGGNYQGRSTTLDRDVRNLKATAVGNDAVSSLRLRCGVAPGTGASGDAGGGGVALFRGGTFTGLKEAFYKDDSDLRNNRIGAATASSVRVARGCSATIYSEPGYRGRSAELGHDVRDLGATRLGNDAAASIRVRCGRGEDRWPDSPGSGSGGGWNPWGERAGGGVTLYAGGDFSGRSETFTSDVERLAGTAVGNDTVSSVRVDPGCRLELFEHPDYGGYSSVLTGDVPDMRRTDLGNDRASSLRIECGRRGYGDTGDRPYGRGGATLYAGGDFSGRSETFHGDVERLAGTAVGNDTVSSVRVDPGCRLELFEHPDYGGTSTVLTGDVPDMRRTNLGNDRASSLRIDCGRGGYGTPYDRGGVTLFRDVDFRGRGETFDRDVHNLGNTQVGNDTVRSVRVARGCRAVLYRHSDFRGESTVLTRDAETLRFTAVGNDAASSIEVNCR